VTARNASPMGDQLTAITEWPSSGVRVRKGVRSELMPPKSKMERVLSLEAERRRAPPGSRWRAVTMREWGWRIASEEIGRE